MPSGIMDMPLDIDGRCAIGHLQYICDGESVLDIVPWTL